MTTVLVKYGQHDLSHFKKGTCVTAEELESLVGVSVDNPQFRIKVLALRSYVERTLGILSRMDGLQLRLLTDSEAVLWNVKRATHHMDGVERAAVRTGLIDPTNLTEQQERVANVAGNAICSVAGVLRQERDKHARTLEILKPVDVDEADKDDDGTDS